MKKGIEKKFLFVGIFILTFISLIYAGWSDHSGIPIQSTTAQKSAHNDMGIRKIGRIGNTIIATGDGVNNNAVHDGIYRSINNGLTWQQVGDEDYTNRGTVLTGPNETFYLFWMSNEVHPGIRMSKFRYDENPSSAINIYSGYVSSVATGGGYYSNSPAIDADGNIYLVAHYKISSDSNEVDRVWLLKSTDAGNIWNSPRAIVYDPSTSFAHPGLEVDHAGNLLLVLAEQAEVYVGGRADPDKRIYFMKSYDKGDTWTSMVQVDGPSGPFGVYNPMIIESKENNYFIFAQQAGQGLVMSKSTNGGQTWSPFEVIHYTTDYADASAAIGDDGTIYITFRSRRDENGVDYGLDLGLCASTATCWKNMVVSSSDEGVTWTEVDSNLAEDRAGPAGSMRYQTWWNYGGPLEWTWEQYLSSNVHIRPVYYDINTDVTIYDIMDSGCVPSCTGKECGEDGCGGSCGICSGSDTCVNYICISTSSCGDADTNQNSVVEIGELINYISQWKQGSVTIGNLISAIGEWKNGC